MVGVFSGGADADLPRVVDVDPSAPDDSISIDASGNATFSGDVNIADTKRLTLSGTSGDYSTLSMTDGDPDIAKWAYLQNSGEVASILMTSTSEAAADGLIQFKIGVTVAQSFDNAGNSAFSGDVSSSGYVKTGSYTVATVPSASASGAGANIFVTDETGGATGAYSDGTNWRRYSDRAIVS